MKTPVKYHPCGCRLLWGNLFIYSFPIANQSEQQVNWFLWGTQCTRWREQGQHWVQPTTQRSHHPTKRSLSPLSHDHRTWAASSQETDPAKEGAAKNYQNHSQRVFSRQRTTGWGSGNLQNAPSPAGKREWPFYDWQPPHTTRRGNRTKTFLLLTLIWANTKGNSFKSSSTLPTYQAGIL